MIVTGIFKGNKMFVVKPMYFKRSWGKPYRLYLVYDTENNRYEAIGKNRRVLVPNYAFEGQDTVLNELKEHFEARGIRQQGWRLHAPEFAPIEQYEMFLAGAEIVAS